MYYTCASHTCIITTHFYFNSSFVCPTAQAEQDRKNRERQQKAEARKAQEAKVLEAQRAEEAAKAKELERQRSEKDALERAEELKRKAEADLAMAAQAKAKAEAEAKAAPAQQQMDDEGNGEVAETQGRVDTTGDSFDSRELVEAALLGAEEIIEEEEHEWKVPKDSSSSKKRQLNKSKANSEKVAVAAGSGFRSSKKYDVMVVNNTQVDDPQVLEGSLKDLLRDKQGPPPKRNAGDLNY